MLSQDNEIMVLLLHCLANHLKSHLLLLELNSFSSFNSTSNCQLLARLTGGSLSTTPQGAEALYSLEFLEGFLAPGHVVAPAFDLVQFPDAVARPRGVDVPNCPKGRLHTARHFLEEDVEARHLLLMNDDTAPGEEGVPIAVHQHTLHHWLRQVAGLGAGAVHLHRWMPDPLALHRPATPVRGPPPAGTRKSHSQVKKSQRCGASPGR